MNYEIFIDDHSCRDTVTLSIYRVSYNRFVVVFEHCLAMTESWKNVLGCGERSWRVGEWALRCYWQHSLFNFVGWASLFSAVCVCVTADSSTSVRLALSRTVHYAAAKQSMMHRRVSKLLHCQHIKTWQLMWQLSTSNFTVFTQMAVFSFVLFRIHDYWLSSVWLLWLSLWFK